MYISVYMYIYTNVCIRTCIHIHTDTLSLIYQVRAPPVYNICIYVCITYVYISYMCICIKALPAYFSSLNRSPRRTDTNTQSQTQTQTHTPSLVYYAGSSLNESSTARIEPKCEKATQTHRHKHRNIETQRHTNTHTHTLSLSLSYTMQVRVAMGAEPHDSSPSRQRYLLLFLLLLLVNLFAVAFFRGGRLRDTHIYMRTYIYVWVGEHATVSFHRECLRYIYIYTYICICVCVGGKGGRNTQMSAFMGGVCVIYMCQLS